jgi:hypothetical protein
LSYHWLLAGSLTFFCRAGISGPTGNAAAARNCRCGRNPERASELGNQPYNKESTRTGKKSPDAEKIRIILPGELPPMPPESARALLRILLAARARRIQEGKEAEDHA